MQHQQSVTANKTRVCRREIVSAPEAAELLHHAQPALQPVAKAELRRDNERSQCQQTLTFCPWNSEGARQEPRLGHVKGEATATRLLGKRTNWTQLFNVYMEGKDPAAPVKDSFWSRMQRLGSLRLILLVLELAKVGKTRLNMHSPGVKKVLVLLWQ